MKNLRSLSDKSKRILAVTGCSILCVVLVATIVPQFYTKAQEKDLVPSSSKTASSSAPNVNSATSSKVVTVQTTTQSASSAASTPAKTDQATQNLQPKVTKPAAPSESEAKNPSKPPSSSTSSKSTSSQAPNAGDKNDGKIYVPGFGWVTDNGGGGSGSTVGKSGDQLTGNKVGQMN